MIILNNIKIIKEINSYNIIRKVNLFDITKIERNNKDYIIEIL